MPIATDSPDPTAAPVWRTSFLRDASVLVGGTVIAQIIPLLVLPVLSRMYTPELFAVLALVMSAAAVTRPISTGYYEQAILNPRTLGRAQLIGSIAVWMTCLTTVLLLIGLGLSYPLITARFSPNVSAIWVTALPVALFCGSMSNIANYWLLRAGKHGLQSGIKLVHAVANAGLAIALGVSDVANGLVYAFMFGVTCCAAWGMYWSFHYRFRMVRLPLRRYVIPAIHHYREFPVFGSFPAALNNIAVQLPLVFITASFAFAYAGHFSITRNLLNGGLILVASCIGQLLLKHLLQRVHANTPLFPFFARVTGITFALGAAGGALLYLFGPWFFSIYLGKGWEDSGMILRTLSVGSPFVLAATSLAPAVIAIRRLKVMAQWQLFYALASACLYFFVHLPFETFIWRVVEMECLVYGLCLPLIAWHVRDFDRTRAML